MARPRRAPDASARATTIGTKRPALKDTTNTVTNKSDTPRLSNDAVKSSHSQKSSLRTAPQQRRDRTAPGVNPSAKMAKSSMPKHQVTSSTTGPRTTRQSKPVVPSMDPLSAVAPPSSTTLDRLRDFNDSVCKPTTVERIGLPTSPNALDLSQSTTLSLDLSSSPSTHSNMTRLSIINLQASNYRLQATPSADTSSLALKNFRRRPRQGSILGIVQQRLASADNSAIQVAMPEDPDSSELDTLATFEEDDFRPEAWGTPVNAAPRESLPQSLAEYQTLDSPAQAHKPGTRQLRSKRSRDEMYSPEHPIKLSSGPRKRRQLSSPIDIEVLAERPRKPHRVRRDSSNTIESGIQVANSPRLSSDEESFHSRSTLKIDNLFAERTQQADEELDIEDDPRDLANSNLPASTMADPLSSSPPPTERTREPLPRNRRPKLATKQPISGAAPRNIGESRSKKTSTAALQSLLPRRRQPLRTARQRRNILGDVEVNTVDSFEISSDNDDDSGNGDNDDDSYGKYDQSRTRGQIRSKAVHRRPKQLQNAARKDTVTPKAATASRVRTYGRLRDMDKENIEDEAHCAGSPRTDPDAPELSMVEAAQSDELQKARLRFADVDNWNMEFESISVDEDRSSSQTWR